MLFNSIQFLIFFPIVTLLYFAAPPRLRWALLLGASCYFYMAFIPIYILILVFTIVIDYCAGLLIERAQGARRTALLVVSFAANVGVLAMFKYANFLNANLAGLFRLFQGHYPIPDLGIILPIGLSFHTFQAMSYTIEVYRGHQPAERHLGIYALYVMFYPQLVAGPIERPQNLLPQLRATHGFNYDRVTDGLKLMLWGFFKKMVVADRLARIVAPVYAAPRTCDGPELLLATVFFAFQIYADFSGYSDIALGAAQVLGITLMQNFRSPYYAQSPAEFWHRWHISLSTWFRDYLYVPLGGSRVPRYRWQLNLLITFLISGLWHGANWTYVIWGGLNGAYLLVAVWTQQIRARLMERVGPRTGTMASQVVCTVSTFCLITFTWIFFRANTVSDAFYIVTHLFSRLPELLYRGHMTRAGSATLTRYDVAMSSLAITALMLHDFYAQHTDLIAALRGARPGVRWAVYYAVGLAVVCLGQSGARQFIYFQF
jgi:alginate O-acetyltransferase complex protein AlgI